MSNIKYSHSEVRVEVYHYTDETTTSVKVIELKDIIAMQLSKDINSPSGSFNLTSSSSQNWKRQVSPGDWILIYLKNDEEERLKMIGNVDRVSRVEEVSGEGILTVKYQISGRDFGKVFEKTNIYFNPFVAVSAAIDQIILKEGILLEGSPSEVITKTINLFLGKGLESVPGLNQWFISKELKSAIFGNQAQIQIKSEGASFIDILDLSEIKETRGYTVYESISALQGFLFNLLKQKSNPPINELFLELKFDPKTKITKPAVFHGIIPFTEEKFIVDASAGEARKFVDLDKVTITDKDILFSDLGEADHNRFNFIFITSSGSAYFNQEYLPDIQAAGDIPKINIDSIKRNGLLLRADTTDMGFVLRAKKGENDFAILKAWNHLLAHWWENSHKLESGTMRILYNKDVYLGKVLEVTYENLQEKFLYYIEGYNISWAYPGTLLMDLNLTRGRKEKYDNRFIEQSNTDDLIYTRQNKVGK